MFIFDTDHLGFLQLRDSAEFQRLKQRMSKYRSQDFFVSIVSFHKQINGWTAFIARRKDPPSLVRGYDKLQSILNDFSEANVLPFSIKASEADIWHPSGMRRCAGRPDRRCACGDRRLTSASPTGLDERHTD